MEAKVKKGGYPTLAPIGYKNDPYKHTVEIDTERSPYIQKAFTLMATGNYSIDMLGDLLFKEGLRSKRGNEFAKSSIHRTLHNPFYYGLIEMHGFTSEGKNEPLITKELFDKVQQVMHGKNRVQPHTQKRNFAFSNLASCQHCGCKVLGEIKKGEYIYYHCSRSKGYHEACVPSTTESQCQIYLLNLFAM